MKKKESDKLRLKEIELLRSCGMTYEKIGKIYGLERERIGQIIRKHFPKLRKIKPNKTLP